MTLQKQIKGDKILLRGDAFSEDKKIEIVIKIPNEIYLKEKVNYRQIDFIEKTLKNELETIENYRRSNADYFGTLVLLEII